MKSNKLKNKNKTNNKTKTNKTKTNKNKKVSQLINITIPDKMRILSNKIGKSISSKKNVKSKSNARIGHSNSGFNESSYSASSLKHSFKMDKTKLFEELIKISKSFTCKDINESRINEHLGSGVTNRVDLFCVDTGCKLKAACRFMPISKNYPINSSHPVNVEIAIYKIFNKLNTPHVPILYKNLKCHYTDVLVGDDIISQYKDQIDTGEITDNLNIMLLEFCEGGSLKDFINKYKYNITYLTCAIFQVLASLTILQVNLKNFRHNDLHNNNIAIGNYHFPNEETYIKSLNKNKSKKYYVCYEMLGTKFYIPYLGFCIKIFDFDVSCADGIPNSKVRIDTVYKENGVICRGNAKFDAHLSINSPFHSLAGYDEGFFSGILSSKSAKIHKKMLDFYNRSVPQDYRGFNSAKLGYARVKEITNFPKELKTAIELLQDSIFIDYRTLPTDGDIIWTYHTGIENLTSLKSSHPEIFS